MEEGRDIPHLLPERKHTANHICRNVYTQTHTLMAESQLHTLHTQTDSQLHLMIHVKTRVDYKHTRTHTHTLVDVTAEWDVHLSK